MILSPTSSPLSVPVIVSGPIKFCAKLDTLSAQQEGWSCCNWNEIVKIVKALLLLPAHFEDF